MMLIVMYGLRKNRCYTDLYLFRYNRKSNLANRGAPFQSVCVKCHVTVENQPFEGIIDVKESRRIPMVSSKVPKKFVLEVNQR